MKNEEFTDKWERCLQMIAGKVSPHVFDTWFKDIILKIRSWQLY